MALPWIGNPFRLQRWVTSGIDNAPATLLFAK